MTSTSETPTYLHLDDIRKHSAEDDCWIIVHSKVYDVSTFHKEHPGGSSIIMRYAGRDATASYDEIHAPGILEDTLPPDRFLGFVHEAELTSLDKETSIEKPKAVIEIPSSTGYSKPDLHRLISVRDFEDVARNLFTAKAFAFYSSAATDLVTHAMNSDFYRRILIRPRVLRNVKTVNIRRTIMGCDSSAPFFVSPAAMAKLAHPEGELALARGCGAEDIIQIISSNASYPLGSIVKAGLQGQHFFLQLYVNTDREKSAQLLRKAKELGIRAIFVTVDAPIPGKREADERIAAENDVVSAISGARAENDKKGGGMGRLMAKYVDSTLCWDDIQWIKETSGLPVVLKGVQSAMDAKLALEYGAEGILLSNHGGRSLDTAQPSILTLLELHKIAPEIFGKLEIYVDGGITRGTDIVKALALGATAVGVGRPYLYSLAYGTEGVEHLTSILKDELETSLKLCGVTDIDQLHPGMLNTGNIDAMVLGNEHHPYIQWKPKCLL
ncbi:FMN-dependent dehydrogenase-domain-containing protein [Tricladium varicosporioides]|nr:FMN-dependent dehydrogenase-domain-containing protein [Hymenoscyphus varicosporioides]